MPILLGEINSRIGKAKFNLIRIVLYTGDRSSIIIGKYMKKLRDKMIKTVRWSTQGGDFNTTFNINIEIIMTELDMVKSLPWIFMWMNFRTNINKI